MNSRSLWAVLDRCPFPEDVVSMKLSVLKELIAHSSRKKAEAAQKAKALHQAAKKSIGVKRIGSADRYRVKICLEEVKRTVLMLKDIDRQMKGILKEIPYSEYLLSYTRHRTPFSRCFLRRVRRSCVFSERPSDRQICRI